MMLYLITSYEYFFLNATYNFDFQSVHSNAIEKNRILYTLLQHGVETTVDRSQKNSRIINWIRHGQPNDVGIDEPDIFIPDLHTTASKLESKLND